MTTYDRRAFLARAATATGGGLLGTSGLLGLTSRAATAAEGGDTRAHAERDYGPLAPAKAENEPGGPAYLALPAGFSYVVFGKIGEPMSRHGVHPNNLDGMAAFAGPRGLVRLVRNHEDRGDPGAPNVGGPADKRRDPLAGGGTTTLDYDPRARRLVDSFVSLNGTIVNCAGGKAYGDAGWFTCEETVAGPEDGWARKHGYVYFVPADADDTVASEAIKAMGRFAHEAVAVNPKTGNVFLTEDAGSGRGSGFYRYVVDDPRHPERGGKLQMLAVKGRPRADLREGQRVGQAIECEFVRIEEPDPDPAADEATGESTVYQQGYAEGGAKFNRLEGIWYGNGRFYVASTSGGDAKSGDVNDDGYEEGFGQIWEWDPWEPAADSGTLTLLYESTGGGALDSPDNLTVTPRGGIVICEDDASGDDGDTNPLAPGITDVNRLVGLTKSGRPFEFAVNRLNSTELAGACFSPDGQTLFFNIYGDGEPGSGMTVAVTGPWERGAL